MIVTAFFKALGQIGDPRFRRVLILGIALSIGLLVATTAGFLWLLDLVIPEGITIFGREITALDDLASGAAIALMLVLSVFLMMPVASAITSMFLEDVAQAVEDRHYPNLPAVPGVSIVDALRDTLAFLGLLIVANLLALILYFMFPPFALFIFWGLNGLLLGREYITLAAMRRIGREGAKQLRRENFLLIWIAGILMAIPLSIPLLNLVIPILGAATFTHIFHMLNSRRATN